MPPAAVIFHRLGPYHVARLTALARSSAILSIELAAETAEYAWDRVESGPAFERETIFSNGDSRNVSTRELVGGLHDCLERCKPSVVAIPGWSEKGALAALSWCVDSMIPVVLMSESTHWDTRRIGWKESVKRRIVRLCSAGLAGGEPHAEYLSRLGMPRERVFLGYDVVDNEYFARKTEEVRARSTELRARYRLPERYLLASARFVDKKNLPALLEAYARYREFSGKSESEKRRAETWSLVLLGDGPLKENLKSQISNLKLHEFVQLPGFKQYDELPVYYGLASAFIHASTTEQWGLVVNEAMASGLPVLVSDRCGCAPDLVRDGVNGFTFNPFEIDEMADRMLRLFSLPEAQRSSMGSASMEIISHWGLERFTAGSQAAFASAIRSPLPKANPLDRLLLRALLC